MISFPSRASIAGPVGAVKPGDPLQFGLRQRAVSPDTFQATDVATRRLTFRGHQATGNAPPLLPPGLRLGQAEMGPMIDFIYRVFGEEIDIPREAYQLTLDYMRQVGDPLLAVLNERGDVVATAFMMKGEDGKTGQVFGVAVDEQYRRQGIARLLMLRLIETARATGLKRLTLGVPNPNAVRLYEMLGFKMTDDPTGGEKHSMALNL